MKKLDEAKLPTPTMLDQSTLQSSVAVTDGHGGDLGDEAYIDADQPVNAPDEVYSHTLNRTNGAVDRQPWLIPHRFTSESARQASLLRQDNRLDRQVTKALAAHYDAQTVVKLFDEGFSLARSRQSPKAFVEALSLLMGYLVGEPLKRQVTATTTLEDMMARYVRLPGEAGNTPPGGEGVS